MYKHQLNRACLSVVSKAVATCASDFSANSRGFSARVHSFWRIHPPFCLWATWHLLHSRRQRFRIWRHRPSRLMLYRLEDMLISYLVLVNRETCIYIIVRLIWDCEQGCTSMSTWDTRDLPISIGACLLSQINREPPFLVPHFKSICTIP